MTFERLLKDYLVKKIDEIFFELSNSIGALMKINKEIQYIDGTKLEADAGKYTFVYKTKIINARKKLWQKISDSIADINKNRRLGFNQNDKYCAQEIGYIVQYLFEIMKQEKLKMPIWIGIQEIVLLESAIRIRLRLLEENLIHIQLKKQRGIKNDEITGEPLGKNAAFHHSNEKELFTDPVDVLDENKGINVNNDTYKEIHK